MTTTYFLIAALVLYLALLVFVLCLARAAAAGDRSRAFDPPTVENHRRKA